MAWPGDTKYQRLADELVVQPGDAVTRSLTEITAILRRPLPAGAYLRTGWTRSGAHAAHVRCWRAAGWEVHAVLRRAGAWWVTFQRRRP